MVKSFSPLIGVGKKDGEKENYEKTIKTLDPNNKITKEDIDLILK